MTPTTGTDPHPIDPTRVVVSGHAAASLVEQLELCDQFLRTASDAVQAELRDFLDSQPSRPDVGWLIDMLGFNALYLQGKLARTHHTTDHASEGDHA